MRWLHVLAKLFSSRRSSTSLDYLKHLESIIARICPPRWDLVGLQIFAQNGVFGVGGTLGRFGVFGRFREFVKGGVS